MTSLETHRDIHQPDMDIRAKLGESIVNAARLRAVTMPEAKALLEAAEVPGVVSSEPYDQLLRSRILMGLGDRATRLFTRIDKREAHTGVLLGLSGSNMSRILPVSRTLLETHTRVKNHAVRSNIAAHEVVDLFATRDIDLLHADRPMPATVAEEPAAKRAYLSKGNMLELLESNREYLESDEISILEAFIQTGSTPKAAKLAGITQADYKKTIDSIRNKFS